MKRKIFFIKPIIVLLIFLIGISLTGCALFSKRSDVATGPQPLEPNIAIKFADIPVPAGFKFLQKDSYSFLSGNVRVAVLRYSGRPNANRVMDFYKEQMPIYNWGLLNTVEYGTRLLNFDRENESCIIAVEPRKLSTLITVSLGPKHSVAKKAEKPVK